MNLILGRGLYRVSPPNVVVGEEFSKRFFNSNVDDEGKVRLGKAWKKENRVTSHHSVMVYEDCGVCER